MGLPVGALYLLKRLLEAGTRGYVRLHAYHLVSQEVSGQAHLPSRRGRSTKIREIGETEALQLPVERPAHVLKSRFRQGARCLMASQAGRFVGFFVFTAAKYEEDEVRCLFVPMPGGQSAWDFDVYVDPSARLGFAFGRLWDEANALYSGMGVRWSLSRISAFNAGSLAAHGRFRLLRVASVVFLSVGPVQFMLATQRPYLHVAPTRGSRPVLRVWATRRAGTIV